jgi:hypothetical protein
MKGGNSWVGASCKEGRCAGFIPERMDLMERDSDCGFDRCHRDTERYTALPHVLEKLSLTYTYR